MILLRDDDRRFRGLRLKVGAFVATAVLSVVATLLVVAARQGYFAHKTPLVFVSDTGHDLHTGMEVKFSGFTIGEVATLQLDDAGRVRITVLIQDRYLKWLRADSIGKVGRDGLIGDAYIDVGVGDLKRPQVQPNAELPFEAARSMDQVIDEVRARTMPVVDDMARLVHRLSAPDGDLVQTLANLRRLSNDLDGTRARLDSTLDNINAITAKEVPATLASTQRTIETADSALKDVQRRLPGILDRVDSALGHVDATTRSLQQTVEQAAPDTVGLIRDARDLARKGNEAADGLERSWPLDKIVAPPADQPKHADSQGLVP